MAVDSSHDSWAHLPTAVTTVDPSPKFWARGHTPIMAVDSFPDSWPHLPTAVTTVEPSPEFWVRRSTPITAVEAVYAHSSEGVVKILVRCRLENLTNLMHIRHVKTAIRQLNMLSQEHAKTHKNMQNNDFRLARAKRAKSEDWRPADQYQSATVLSTTTTFRTIKKTA
ncbi:hypothetical protein Y032_0258g467 [Ancylostoma ceylanicum]|nr:hypothetical protein Y032_0258g467 [Ancylostoma ceylanicum]